MFSVYGVTGRVFTGSMEQLRQIEQVNAASRLRRLESHETDLVDPVLSDSTFGGLPGAGPARTAIAAYAQAQQGEAQRQPLTRVAQLMVTPVVTLPQDTPVLEAWKLLAYHGFAQAPVVNAAGILVGLVRTADLLNSERLATTELDPAVWKTLMAQPIQELMITPVPSVAADTDVRRVAGVLLDTGLSGLPVVDEAGNVRAFIARGDILRAVAHDPPLDLWG